MKFNERIKENINFCGNKLNLIDLTETDFLNKIDNIYKRKDII